jgi:hypothetical protein
MEMVILLLQANIYKELYHYKKVFQMIFKIKIELEDFCQHFLNQEIVLH